ncbi:hypothetical protein [Microbulbifer sp. ZKSA002]|uniref:hypothetical protein n=1 Tax=Microbulbifer sp. ZKSA002 TaxID=3243388 RepID=UPI00403A5F2C
MLTTSKWQLPQSEVLRGESRFKSLMGSAEAVRQACIQLNKRWVHGIGNCKGFHSATPY